MDRIWAIAAAGAVAVLLGGTAGYLLLNRPGEDAFAQCRGGQAGAEIGGPFTLVEGTSGKTMTEAEVIDRPTLVYFGYTMCPDVCPMDMSRNAEVADLLDEQGRDIRLAFVTVDPGRDTAQVVSEFAQNIHPKAIGLTGTDQQVKQAADAYRVYFKLGDTSEEFYLVDHTSFSYLMMPGIGFAEFYKHGAKPEEVAASVSCFMAAQEG